LHLEYHYYEALVLTDILHQIKQAEYDGYDAAVIGCFYDPGLREAREIVENLVVTAPAEAAMHIATTLGHTFSVLVGRKKWIPKMHENVVKYGFSDQLASFKPLEMGVYDFQKDPAETAQRMRAAAKEAVEYEAWLNSFNDPMMLRMAHVCYGFSPGARLCGNILEDERVWGGTEWGLGQVGLMYVPPEGIKGASHTDGICLNTSVWLDGKQITDKGKVLDPKLASLVKQLGKA